MNLLAVIDSSKEWFNMVSLALNRSGINCIHFESIPEFQKRLTCLKCATIILECHSFPPTDETEYFISSNKDLNIFLAIDRLEPGVIRYIYKSGAKGMIIKSEPIYEELKQIIEIIKPNENYFVTYPGFREFESFYRRLAPYIDDLLCITDESGYYAYVSPSHLKVLGYNETDLLGNYIFDFLHADDKNFAMQKFKQSIDTGIPDTIECRYLTKDQKYIWLEVNGNVIRNEKNAIIGIALIARNIQFKKLTEIELSKSNQLLNRIIDVNPDIIFYKDQNLKYRIANKAFEQFTGKNISIMLEPVDSQIWQKNFADTLNRTDLEVLQTGRMIETEEKLEGIDGNHYVFNIRKIPVFDAASTVTGICTLMQDISIQKLTEEILDKKIQYLILPETKIPELEFNEIFNIDEVQMLQDAFAAATGISAVIKTHDGKNITKASQPVKLSELFKNSPIYCENWCCSESKIMQSNENSSFEKTYCCEGLIDAGAKIYIGNKHIANWFIGPVIDANANKEKVKTYSRQLQIDHEEFNLAIDQLPAITVERFDYICETVIRFTRMLSAFGLQTYKQAKAIAEIKLKDAEQRRTNLLYKNIFEHSTDAIVLSTPALELIKCNRKAAELIGLKNDEDYTGLNPFRFISGNEALKAKEMLDKLLNNNLDLPFTLNAKNQNGKHLVIEVKASIIYDENKQPLYILSIFQDITERIQKEIALRQSEEKYRALVENAKEVIMRFNRQYVHLYVNPVISEYFHLTPDDFIGKTHRDLGFPADMCLYWEQLLQKVFDTGEVVNDIFKIETQKGLTTFEWQLAPVFDTNNAVETVITTARDVSSRVNTEQSLLISEQRYKSIVENQPDLVVRFRPDGEITYFNNIFEEYFGINLNQKPVSIYNFIPDYLKSRLVKLVPDFEKSHSSFTYDLKMQTIDKTYRYIQWNGKPIYGNEGQAIEFQAIGRDVTEFKLATDALKASEKKYRTIFENIQDVFFQLDLSGKITQISPSVEKYSGYKPEELIGLTVENLYFNPADRKILLENLEKQGDLRDFELTTKDKTGKPIVVSVNAQYLKDENGNIIGLEGALRDISYRKAAEEELKLNETRLESLLLISQMYNLSQNQILENALNEAIKLTSSSFGFIFIYDEKSKIITSKIISEPLQHLINQSENTSETEVKLTMWNEIINKGKPLIQNVISNKTTSTLPDIISRYVVTPVYSKNKIVAVAGVYNKKMYYSKNDANQLILMMDSVWNMLEKQKIENQLKISERQKSAILAGLDDVYIEYIDKNFNIIYSNKPPEVVPKGKCKMPGVSCFMFIEELANPCETCSVIQSFEKRTPVEGTIKSGKGRYFMLKSYPVFDDKHEVEGVIHLAIDITHQKNIENELIKAKEKAEESDRLKSAFLANMSHEIRTPMNAIIGFSELIQRPRIPAKKKETFSKIIQTKCNDLLTIIDDILDISRIEAGQMKITVEEFDPGTIIDDIVIVADQKLTTYEKNNIRLKISKPERIKKIKSDPVRVKQVIQNFVDNAIKFTEKGHIEIGLRYRKNHAEFYVSDTGIGIPKEKTDLIFDRFSQIEHTAQRNNSGIGLGLSICKGISYLLNGKIWVVSEENKGSTFYFAIPFKITK